VFGCGSVASAPPDAGTEPDAAFRCTGECVAHPPEGWRLVAYNPDLGAETTCPSYAQGGAEDVVEDVKDTAAGGTCNCSVETPTNCDGPATVFVSTSDCSGNHGGSQFQGFSHGCSPANWTQNLGASGTPYLGRAYPSTGSCAPSITKNIPPITDVK